MQFLFCGRLLYSNLSKEMLDFSTDSGILFDLNKTGRIKNNLKCTVPNLKVLALIRAKSPMVVSFSQNILSRKNSRFFWY